MVRTIRLLLPALAIAMLGGCVTSGYQYRGGSGDYYYGQPQVEYRDYGSPYGGYGYGTGGWSGGFGYNYGSPYDYYGYGGYYDPYRYYYPRRPPVVIVRPRTDGDHGHDHHHGDRPPPWRDPGGVDRPDRPIRDPALPPERPAIDPRSLPPQRPAIDPRSFSPGRPAIDPASLPAPMPRMQDRPTSGGPRERRQEPDRDLRRKREP